MPFISARIVIASGADPAKYREEKAPRGDPAFIMSSSPLRDFAHSPSRWIHGYTSKDTDATDWGSLLDCRFLTPEQFNDRVAITPAKYTNDKGEVKDWHNGSNKCKAWNEHQIALGKQIVSPEDVIECDKAIKRLQDDATIASWHAESAKQVWVAGEWKDDATGIVVPVKCLLDYVPNKDSEYFKCLGDLKSTRSAFPAMWPRYVKQRGYHLQGSFNTDLYVAATGEERISWCWILSENYAPYEVGREMMAEDFLAMGRAEYQIALARYARCLKTNHWPGYDEMNPDSVDGWSLASPEPWMSFEIMSKTMESDFLNRTEDASDDSAAPDDIVP